MTVVVNPFMVQPAEDWDDDADAYFAAMTTPPGVARKGLINDLVEGLKADGLWSRLDCLWICAAHDAQAGRLNLRNPAAHALTAVGGATFVVDGGYDCDGVDDHLTADFNFSSTSGRVFAATNAHLSAYLNAGPTTAAANRAVISAASGSTLQLRPNHAGGMISWINQVSGSPMSGPTVATRLGWRLGARNGGAVYNYAETTSASGVISATAAANATVWLMRASSGYLEGRIASASIGSYMDATNQGLLRSRILTYLTAIGAA